MGQLLSITHEGVCFDPDEISLLGIYGDELALFRARKRWLSILESSFMLESGHDFQFDIATDYECCKFRMICRFNTACGRYAFWRLTNAQAPEAQYEIETAHIPDAESRRLDFASALDMLPIGHSPLVIQGIQDRQSKHSFLGKASQAIRNFLRKKS